MHKRRIVITSALVGLIIASLSIEFAFQHLINHNQWFGFIIGVVFMIMGVISYQFGKKHVLFYMLSFVLNMIGVGLSITAYYVLAAFPLDFEHYVIAIAVAMGLLIGFAVVTNIPIMKKHSKVWLVLTIIAAFGLSLTLWILSDTFTGLSFYFINIIFFYMVSVVEAVDDDKDVFKELAKISAGAFVLVSIIVLVILTEGEALQGLDGFNASSISGKKRGQ